MLLQAIENVADMQGFSRGVCQCDRGAVRCSRFAVATQLLKEGTAGTVIIKVVFERCSKGGDEVERGLWARSLEDGYGAVECDDRRWGVALKGGIQLINLGPVCVLWLGCTGMERGDRCL